MNFPTIVKVPKGCGWPHNPQDHSGSPSTLGLEHKAVRPGPRRQLSTCPPVTARGQQLPTPSRGRAAPGGRRWGPGACDRGHFSVDSLVFYLRP